MFIHECTTFRRRTYRLVGAGFGLIVHFRAYFDRHVSAKPADHRARVSRVSWRRPTDSQRFFCRLCIGPTVLGAALGQIRQAADADCWRDLVHCNQCTLRVEHKYRSTNWISRASSIGWRRRYSNHTSHRTRPFQNGSQRTCDVIHDACHCLGAALCAVDWRLYSQMVRLARDFFGFCLVLAVFAS